MKKIFCIGLSRTGTTSIHDFLLSSSVASIHYPIQLFTAQNYYSQKWREALDAAYIRKYILRKELNALQKVNADDILLKYHAFSDLPIPLMFEQLDVKFPGSKFVLSTRSLAGWLKSMEWLYQEGPKLWGRGIVGEALMQQMYGCKVYDEAKLKRAWETYHLRVRNYFEERPGDLYTFDIDHGSRDLMNMVKFLELPEGGPMILPKSNKMQASFIKKPTADTDFGKLRLHLTSSIRRRISNLFK